MKIAISDARKVCINALVRNGFTQEESEYCVENLLEAELAGKKNHGLMRVAYLVNKLKSGEITSDPDNILILKETPVSMLIDGRRKTGLYVISKSLDLAIEKAKSSGLFVVGITNTSPISGMIGHYAHRATDNNLIFIGFNNSSGGLVPYGSTKDILGTNPFTVGVPTNNLPVILDMASSKITWGDLLTAVAENKEIPDDVAIDSTGKITTNPKKAMEGGLLPLAEHKGSGLAFIVEILAGALTKSRCGYDIKGGWGSLFFLMDPNILRPADEFKNDVNSLINEIKNSPKMQGFEKIYYPGEQSQLIRKKSLLSGYISIREDLYKSISSI